MTLIEYSEPKYDAFFIKPCKSWAAYRSNGNRDQIGPLGYGDTKEDAVKEAEDAYRLERIKERERSGL